MSEAEIARLREEIADVDRETVALVAKRLHLAEQLGLEKKLLGRPVVAEDTEDRVFTRLLTEGATRGISLTFVEGLARLLIDESVRRQDSVRLPTSAKQKILVVGGAGQMGRWLCRYFRSRGYQVVVSDPAGPLGTSRSSQISRRAFLWSMSSRSPCRCPSARTSCGGSPP